VEGTRSALIIASYEYADPGLRRLRAPASDARALEAVLRDSAIGGFEVRTLLNEPAHEISLAVEDFFADRRPDDLLLVHFSCHGIKDEDGELYFATANTALRRLGATAVAADFVNRRMSRSRSRRIVLLLDCCYAGAFERGMTARAGTGMGIEAQFGGRGRAVITASSAMEYAFEGDELSDTREHQPSVFTSALVEGLSTGDADRDQDGMVALDELYDYVYDKVRATTPNQTPGKWTFGVQGDLHIARRARPVTTPAALPPELRQAIDSPFASVRVAALQELVRLLHGAHAGLALAARQAMERLTSDDSRAVAAAAAEALDDSRTAATATTVTAATTASTATTGAAGSTTRWKPVPARLPAAAPASSAAPGAGDNRATPQARDDRRLVAAGGLAIVGAVLALLAPFPEFVGSFRLISVPANVWAVVISNAVAFCAAVCIFVPRTRRLIGPGLLLGAVATAPNAFVYDTTWLVGQKYGSAGPGLWLDLVGNAILVLAACVAGLGLARAGEVRFALRRPPEGRLAWLVVLLGVAGAIALFLQIRGGFVPGRDKGFSPAEDLVPLVWSSVMALVIPPAAAVARPRRFGVALLAGWIGCGTAVAVFSTTLQRSVFGYTLLALLVVITPFARAAPTSGGGRAT
jgi:hypothetical protein